MGGRVWKTGNNNPRKPGHGGILPKRRFGREKYPVPEIVLIVTKNSLNFEF
jgi:hypothetical protein